MTVTDITGRLRLSPTARPTWTSLVVASAARTVLIVVACLGIWAAGPALWGWQPTTVSSDSMAPGIRTGDAIVAMPVATTDIRIGQVLLVDDPDHPERLRLHRLVDVSADGDLLLKGDANPVVDSTPVNPATVHGVGVIRVPFVGLPGFWIQQRDIPPILGLIAAGVVLLWLSRVGDRPSRHVKIMHGRRRALLPSTLTVILMLGIGSTVAAPPEAAYAAFTRTTTNPSSTFAALASFPCLSPTPADSPYLFYPFSEATGTLITDSSGNGRDGTMVGSAVRATGTCLASGSPALSLNGTNAFVATPASTSMTSPSAFTIETWIRTTTASGGRIIGFGESRMGTSTTSDRHIYMTDTGKLVFGVIQGGNQKTASSSASFNDGAWHLVAARVAGTTLELFVDGVLVANGTSSNPASYTGFWRVGYDNLAGWPQAPTSSYFGGTIDNAAVYLSTLSNAQILAHYNAGR